MNILGINAFHGDASAALVCDGRLVAAVEEERFNRVKHWAGFPELSVAYCLSAAGLGLRDIDHVAVSFDSKAHLWRKLLYAAKYRPSASSILDKVRRRASGLSLQERFAKACGGDVSMVRATFHSVEHHMAHLASTFFVSPFEQAAILSVDGMGDFVSTLAAAGEGTTLTPHYRIFWPHSLGFLYNALTLYLGFMSYGDEYKVMGLAPYGEPEFQFVFKEMVSTEPEGFSLNLDFFRHQREGIAMSWEGIPKVEPFHSALLEQRLGPSVKPGEKIGRREENIAHSLQQATEEVMFDMLCKLHARRPCDTLCLAGGVAMNAVVNGKIAERTPFKRVFVPVGAADNGTSFGAAFYVWHSVLKQPRSFVLEHAYWGPEFGDDACGQAAAAAGMRHQHLGDEELFQEVAARLDAGEVVGWFQGRMEFGARALGNRSLLADPRRADMRDTINLRIKFREKFRPFAPSILEEHAREYFTESQFSPFMERVLSVRPEKRAAIPAVVHVDGSGRLQTVSRTSNPRYYRLIEHFYRKSGVPIVLNTSLNENEPIVNTPEQALSCFLRTEMDSLALGNHLISRR